MTFKIRVVAFEDCRELATFVSFKLGLSGEHLLETPRLTLSKTPLKKGDVVEASIRVNTKDMPAALLRFIRLARPGRGGDH